MGGITTIEEVIRVTQTEEHRSLAEEAHPAIIKRT
jgi:hypothetical protein